MRQRFQQQRCELLYVGELHRQQQQRQHHGNGEKARASGRPRRPPASPSSTTGGKEPLAKTTYTLAGNSNSGAVTANAASEYTQPDDHDEANRGRSMAAGILVNGAADGRHMVTFSGGERQRQQRQHHRRGHGRRNRHRGQVRSTVQNVSNSGAVTIGDIGRNNDEASGYYVGGIAATR